MRIAIGHLSSKANAQDLILALKLERGDPPVLKNNVMPFFRNTSPNFGCCIKEFWLIFAQVLLNS